MEKPTRVHQLLSQLDSIEAESGRLRSALTDNAKQKREMDDELKQADAEGAPLLAQWAELEPFCTGEYDAQEYARRKARCDAELPPLDARIREFRERRARIVASNEKRAGDARELGQSLARLNARGTGVVQQVQSLPGPAIAIGCIGTAATSAWVGCVRETLCASVNSRALVTRAAIEANRRELATSRRELENWTKLNAQAQKDALLAGVRFTFGEYAAGGVAQSRKLERLTREADRLAKKAGSARKSAVRAMYARELHETVARMAKPTKDLLLRQGVKTALTVDQQWAVSRDTLRTEFELARKQTEQLKALLESPAFQEAFKTEDADTPGLDLMATLVEEAGTTIGQRLIGLEALEKSVAPPVRAFVFVRDAWYNAALSYFSTERVVQQSDLAGDLAKAAGALQGQNEDDVLDLLQCAKTH